MRITAAYWTGVTVDIILTSLRIKPKKRHTETSKVYDSMHLLNILLYAHYVLY